MADTCETTFFLSACYVPNVQPIAVRVLGDFLAGKATVLPDTPCDVGAPRKGTDSHTLWQGKGSAWGPSTFSLSGFLLWGWETQVAAGLGLSGAQSVTGKLQGPSRSQTSRGLDGPLHCHQRAGPHAGERPEHPPTRPVSSGRGAERTTGDVRPLGLILSIRWCVPNPPTEPTPRLSPILPTTKLHGT